MIVSDSPLGCSGLLRVSGLPIRYWLAGANPELFEKVTRLERAEDLRRISAIHLAERIGRQLVPNQVVGRRDRAFLLAVRRSLHRGDLITNVSRERLLEMNGLSDGDAEVIEDLVATGDGDRAIAKLSSEIETDVANEEARLLLLPHEIQSESPVAHAILADDQEFEPQLSQKSRRHRNEHEWRCITRAATGCTPRGWLSHVALLTVEAVDWPSPLVVTEQLIALWTENIRAVTTPAHLPDDWPAPESRLALNPLRWNVNGSFVCIVADESREHTQLVVKHTALLEAICTASADAVLTFEELSQSLGCVSGDEWITLRGFVRHLALLGILQPSAPPEIRLERRASPGYTSNRSARLERDHSGWVDVYRYAEGGISAKFASDVQRGVSQVLRILSLVSDSTPTLLALALSGTERSWTSIEILRADLDAAEMPKSNREDQKDLDEEVSQESSSGFDRLVSTIAQQATQCRELIIDSALLDGCGASNAQFTWPIDCLARVPARGAHFTAVLDQLWPSGMLDARFVDTLVDLHGAVPHVEAYRQFLQRLEDLTGILFVELLLPPLRDGAANAVRRPVYTSAWTGDPRAAAYLRAETHPGRYIPLNAIRIRRLAGRLRADVDGRPIWAVYHATRSFSPPWDRLARVLLATAPLELPWDFKRVVRALTLMPQRTVVPRISVSGGIVLSPAQWRVSPNELWGRGANTVAKIRALVRLRNRYSLPRWVYLDRAENQPPIACDLESVYAIRTIERCATDGSLLNVTEMLPAPNQFHVMDRAHSRADCLANQFHLRFPCDESATAMAARVAPAILSALGPSDLGTIATRTVAGRFYGAADTSKEGGQYERHR